MTWRGKAETFENVYHYDLSPNPSDELITAILDELKRLETSVFAPAVTITQGRAHGPTHLEKDDDVMRVVKDYAQVCSGPGSVVVPFELATVAQWYIGRSEKGYKQILRKYFHVCGLNNPGPAGALGNANLQAVERSDLEAKYSNFKSLGLGTMGTVTMCNPQGKQIPLATPTVLLPQLRVRQFRRGSKRKKRATS